MDQQSQQPEEGQVSGEKPVVDFQQVRAIMPEEIKQPWMLRLFLLGLLACGGYGAFYGYSRYKINDMQYAFALLYQDLNMAILRRTTNITKEDVEEVVREMTRKVGIGVVQNSLEVTVQPLSEGGEHKLQIVAQKVVGILDGIPGAKGDPYLVGFKGTFYAKHGVASETYEAHRYTWFKENVIAVAKEKKRGKKGVTAYEPLREEEEE